MSDVNEVLDRISSAIYRSGVALKAMAAAPVPSAVVAPAAVAPAMVAPADDAVLTQALDDERTANAQLQERLRQVKARHDTRMATLEAELAQNRTAMAGMDAGLQGLHQTNADLREVVATLRGALSRGVAEPEMINRALLAEVEALSAARAADLAELGAVYAELKPLLGEAS